MRGEVGIAIEGSVSRTGNPVDMGLDHRVSARSLSDIVAVYIDEVLWPAVSTG